MVTIDDVRRVALDLPRAYEALMGFGFPREEREALVESEPDKFLMPSKGDMRYQWVVARMEALAEDEMRELVIDAWRMCVPKKVAAEYLGENGM